MPPQETKQKHPFNLSDEKAERLAAATLEFYHWFIEQPGGREKLEARILRDLEQYQNRSMENAVIPGLHLDNAEFIFAAPYPNPAGGDFKLPPFGFTLLRIHREKTENGES